LRNPCPESTVPLVNGAIIINKLLLSIRRGCWPLIILRAHITIFSTAFHFLLGLGNLLLEFCEIIVDIRSSSCTETQWMRREPYRNSVAGTVQSNGTNLV
jgi:hypothetical protein